MAKKSNKKLLGTILSFVALALAVVSIVMFFVPTIKSKDSDNFSYSAAEVCFISVEKAKDKAQEETKNLNLNKAAHYTQLAALKNSDDYKGKLGFAAWMEFVAAVAGLVLVVALFLAMFKIKTALLSGIAALVMFAASLAALIGVGALMNVEVASTKFSEAYKFGAGVIVAFITSTLSAASLVTKKALKA